MQDSQIFERIKQNIQAIINHESDLDRELWEKLLNLHPADVAQFLSEIEREDFTALFSSFPLDTQIKIFKFLSEPLQAYTLSFLDDQVKANILKSMPADELIDLFDIMSDKDLKHLFGLLQKKERERVLSLMKFKPESAGGIMDIDVITFSPEFTVANCIQLLQRLQPNIELHKNIYVTGTNHKLLGYIRLEDLLIQKPQAIVSSFMQADDLVINVGEDQEVAAQKMNHYQLTSAPVVSDDNVLLGVIPAETLIDIIEAESSEDIYKMSAMTPIKQTYFETPFFKLFYERSYILIALLLIESFSSIILQTFETTIIGLIAFIPMLTSAGGNTSSQSSALAIQGLAGGEITSANFQRFLKRELLMALAIASTLGLTGFIRMQFSPNSTLFKSLAVSVTLAIIVMISVALGSCIPVLLKRLRIDPAFSAGPFLATLMDILGIVIFCYISQLIL